VRAAGERGREVPGRRRDEAGGKSEDGCRDEDGCEDEEGVNGDQDGASPVPTRYKGRV
jgi:hypothetical protein